ncbi:YhgE/Pip family protein [Cryobacterium soli]|uniref:YhgE/Pip family protein n=1 Tax=Cryobacterium soli TaxID=2220095 RepID=UPI001FE9DCEB|nr:YhgE/Pip domain-containing protein [Cryobacterium soli]
MKIFAMIRAELARLTATTMSRVALVALMLVPVLYGGLYLWANQDPYAGLDRVPVALVVADTGAESDGTTTNYGSDVAEQLIDDGTFDWHTVTAATAKAGVADATYDFSVTIPADFSSSIASSSTDSPHQATITLTTNDTNSYLASTIGSQAAQSIRDAIVARVNEQAADQLLIGLSDIRSSLVDAADGAGQLTDGAGTAADGGSSLADGASQLADGTGQLATGAGSLADGTGKVADGASQVADGTGQVASGADALATGAGTLSTGAGSLAAGTAQVATGADSLATATGQVADGTAALSQGAASLVEGTAKVSAGADQVSAAAQKVADGTTKLNTAAQEASAGVAGAGAVYTDAQAALAKELTADGLSPTQVEAALATLAPIGTTLTQSGAALTQAGTAIATLSTGTTELAAGAAATAAGAQQSAAGATTLATGAATASTGARQTADGAATLASGAHQSADGAAALATGAGQAASGAATLAAGADKTAAGAATLSTGAASAADGAATLSTGASSAKTGAESLATGASSLSDGLLGLKTGAGTLRDGLTNGVNSIPDTDAATRDLQGSTIADPVDLQKAAVTSAGTYGAGLAPFFASLAGWIGIYALFLIVKPVSRRAITALHSPLKITLAGWLTPGILGLLQMAALFGILTGVLHFEVHNPLGTYAMMGLAAMTFAAIILALNVWLGSVGQFVGLVLMVIQLVTAGGTFPWQTLPAPLAFLHHVMPMSYAVDGIRQLMYGGNPATALNDAGVLLLWLTGALVLAAIGVVRMTHFRTLRDLKPSLIG